jgi:hypothetical protein
MAAPIVVIQMQRLGDVVLTFPLLLWLRRQYPDQELWLRADPQFAALAAGLAPPVRWLASQDDPALIATPCAMVIHLGHSAEGARLAGTIPAARVFGRVWRDGGLRVYGPWMRYRESLILANRHNRFHWADLHALDSISRDIMASTGWDPPRHTPTDRVGLFLGASDAAKRPSPAFWAALARYVMRRGLTPVLLGGPAEVPLGEEVRRLVRRPLLDLCGRLSLEKLAVLGEQLALLVSPDTGPMHVAAWTGLRVVNLSLGPVWAWDTAPYQPGHLVVQPSASCSGCWQCSRRLACHQNFAPRAVAQLVESVMAGKSSWQPPSGLILGRTDRDEGGRFVLVPVAGHQAHVRHLLAAYWRALWLAVLGGEPPAACRQHAAALWECAPALAKRLVRSVTQLAQMVAAARTAHYLPWQTLPPGVRPLASYVAVCLESDDFAPSSCLAAMELVEQHLAWISPA